MSLHHTPDQRTLITEGQRLLLRFPMKAKAGRTVVPNLFFPRRPRLCVQDWLSVSHNPTNQNYFYNSGNESLKPFLRAAHSILFISSTSVRNSHSYCNTVEL